VVGLGNPGARYRRTRHNVGFMVVDLLASRAGVREWREEQEASVATAQVDGQDVLLVKPLTFMNRSGVAVESLLSGSGGALSDLVVVVDDVALELGTIRVRERGSHGGHNGLRSLVEVLGSEDFARVRVGIGAGEPGADLAGFVLAEFGPEEVLQVQEMVGRAGDAVACLLREGASTAMTLFNRPRTA
jgi:peptidyl-tRNA hydrolase, PTH1 family